MRLYSQVIPAEIIPLAAQSEIHDRLARVGQEHGARILFAIESGSRAWGFPSPDSDFDVRFIYVLPLEKYFRLSKSRDVIEQPIEGLFDINGWDLRKALTLLLKANPVICEWIRSPIVYSEAGEFRSKLAAIVDDLDERPAAQHHHASLLKGNYERSIRDADQIKLKKYFYCLRPAYALAWMWENPNGNLPMTFSELRRGVNEPESRAKLVDDLLEAKSQTRELGMGNRIPDLDDFIVETIVRAEREDFGRAPKAPEHIQLACEQLLQQIVMTGA